MTLAGSGPSEFAIFVGTKIDVICSREMAGRPDGATRIERV